jgi:hypothetical protein
MLLCGIRNLPAKFGLDPLETCPADPQVNAFLTFSIVRVPVATTLVKVPLRESISVIAYARKTEPAMIMGPILAIAVPTFPNEGRVSPEFRVILPVVR